MTARVGWHVAAVQAAQAAQGLHASKRNVYAQHQHQHPFVYVQQLHTRLQRSCGCRCLEHAAASQAS